MARDFHYFLIHKPYGVLSQFTDEDGHPGLGSVFQLPKDVYPIGRLDRDSEGLLILTNDKKLNHRLLDPQYLHRRTYWLEVEGQPTEAALAALRAGPTINVKGLYKTAPCEAQVLETPSLPDRNPPVNVIKHPVRSWLEISLTEGKNRQVRKMTAQVGHPTLRLIRVAIEDLSLWPLPSGEMTMISGKVLYQKLRINQ